MFLSHQSGSKLAEEGKGRDRSSLAGAGSPDDPQHRSSGLAGPEQEIDPRWKGRLAEIARLPAERRAAAILEHAGNVRMKSDPFGWAELRIFVSAEKSDKVCEKVLTSLLSSGPRALPDAEREELLGAVSSSLAKRYSIAEFSHLIDGADKWQRLAWSHYAIIRAIGEPQEILTIRSTEPLFVPEAQVNAATRLAATDAVGCRRLIEDGTISPTSKAFDESVKKMLSLDSTECLDWIEAFPEDSATRARGYRLIASWLTEIGRPEEAKAFLREQ